ncbi:hypothetical protein GLOIN_2v1779910 [Rhizophagus clarus]|uniref:Uncharacterized protein n=1 Tax=Rhizophagus clarus TaxID=94130 RepID=A0A8H3LCA8_9GLOM|nr:hypothetical protein GLOIN_2v1779910 [Rhizophagus clarus]
MSKKQTARTCKFLRADARRLSPEAIEEIRNAQNNIPDARRIMCKKHRIGSTTYQKIIDNQRPPEPTEEWQDRITHTECLMDNENDTNSNGLNTVTSGRKDKVSQKKKANIKPKDESSSSIALVEKNENKVDNAPKGSDTSRRESDLNKLVNITREAVIHLIFSP